MKKIKDFLKNNPLILAIAILFVISLGLSTMDKDAGKEISYVKFLKMVDEGKVEEATVLEKENFVFFMDDKDVYYKTPNPHKETLVEDLLLKDVEVTSEKPSTVASELSSLVNFLLRVTVIFFIISFILDLMMGNKKLGGGKGKRKGKDGKKKNGRNTGSGGGLFGGRDLDMTIIEPDDEVTLPRFEDIAGNKELKDDLQDVVKMLKQPEVFENLGAVIPKGILLSGAPGTGKTMIAKAVAAEAGVTFIAVTGSDFMQEFVGVGAKRVRQLFEEARKHEKSIIFIDEFDAIGRKRGRNADSESLQTINALLDEMDGFVENENILVIAATNLIETLDDAVIRPGRFDKKIAVALPEYEERLAILNVHAKKKKIHESVNLEFYAKTTIGMSGAYLATMLNEAAMLAGTRGHDSVMPDDMEDAYYRIVMNGLKRDSVKRDEEELRIVAKHEAGHALVAKRLTDNDVTKVTIISSTSGAGGFAMVIPKKMGLFTRNEILNDIRVTYAGRAAEHLYFNGETEVENLLKSVQQSGMTNASILDGFNFTTGASSDIQQATKQIRGMFTNYGMSSKYGMLHPEILTGSEGEGVNDKELIQEAQTLSNKLYYETLKLVYEERELLNRIADALLEKESLTEDELNKIIDDYDAEKHPSLTA